MASTRSRRSALALVTAVLTISGLFSGGLLSGTAGADSADVPTTTTATVNSHDYVYAPAPITTIPGLSDGDQIAIKVDAKPASAIFGVEARECKSSADINNLTDFSPFQSGNCVLTALGTGDLHPTTATAPPNQHALLNFKVGTGTETFTLQDGVTQSTITCDTTHPCQLVLREQTSGSDNPDNYIHYNLNFGTATAPGAPTIGAATGGDSSATVHWTAPASDGGSPITGYRVTPFIGATAQTAADFPNTATSQTVGSLTNGTAYTFKVAATNAIGTGPNSAASNVVTPAAAPGAAFHTLTPARILDSRPGIGNVGGFTTPWGPNTTRDISVGGVGGVPADAVAVVLNVTAVAGSDGNSFLALYPKGASAPTVSNLNVTANEVIPNQVTVKLGTSGMVSVLNHAGHVDVIADVAGYYKADAGDGFTSLTPARILDSRPGGGNAGGFTTPWGPNVTRDISVGGVGGVPADADAVVLNVTVTGPTSDSFLALYPKGASAPTVSNLNFTSGETIPNAVTVKLGTSGKVSVLNHAGNVDVIADVAGYYKAATGKLFHALTPARLLDSRPGGGNVGGFTTPWGPNVTRDVSVGGVAGVPGAADSVVLNVTAVAGSDGNSFLALYPKGASAPTVSNLNLTANEVIPNAVTVKLGTSGMVSVLNHAGHVDVIADVAGYFS